MEFRANLLLETGCAGVRLEAERVPPEVVGNWPASKDGGARVSSISSIASRSELLMSFVGKSPG